MSIAALQTHLEISLCASTTSPIQDPTRRPLDILELSVYLCEAKNWNLFFFGKAFEWIQKVPCAALDLTVGEEHMTHHLPFLPFHLYRIIWNEKGTFFPVFISYTMYKGLSKLIKEANYKYIYIFLL